MPKGVISKIDKLRRGFLWGNAYGGKKMVKINWLRVCSSKKVGGAGIVNIQVKNRALLAKWCWRFAKEPKAIWRRFIMEKYGSSRHSWMMSLASSRNMSLIWKGIVHNMKDEEVLNWMNICSFRWSLRKGDSILFWLDTRERGLDFILSWIFDPSLRPWRWWKNFRDLDCLVAQINNVQFQHIPRDKNHMADHLAKAGANRASLFKAWWCFCSLVDSNLGDGV
ncbi:hypothetical protein V6N13_092316 [Hibiscus sabdariffa]